MAIIQQNCQGKLQCVLSVHLSTSPDLEGSGQVRQVYLLQQDLIRPHWLQCMGIEQQPSLLEKNFIKYIAYTSNTNDDAHCYPGTQRPPKLVFHQQSRIVLSNSVFFLQGKQTRKTMKKFDCILYYISPIVRVDCYHLWHGGIPINIINCAKFGIGTSKSFRPTRRGIQFRHLPHGSKPSLQHRKRFH